VKEEEPLPSSFMAFQCAQCCGIFIRQRFRLASLGHYDKKWGNKMG